MIPRGSGKLPKTSYHLCKYAHHLVSVKLFLLLSEFNKIYETGKIIKFEEILWDLDICHYWYRQILCIKLNFMTKISLSGLRTIILWKRRRQEFLIMSRNFWMIYIVLLKYENICTSIKCNLDSLWRANN